MEHIGTKYDGSRDIKETAKLIRKDIAAAIKAGELAGVKCSVTISRFSGGQSIDVHVTAVPEWFGVYSDDFVRFTAENGPNEPSTRGGYSAVARATIRKLRSIVDEYNRDDSDPQVDYFHKHFYNHVAFDYMLERDALAAAVASFKQAA